MCSIVCPLPTAETIMVSEQSWFALWQNLFSHYLRGKKIKIKSLEQITSTRWKSGYSNWSSFSTTAWSKGVHCHNTHRAQFLLAPTGVAWQAASPGRGECHPSWVCQLLHMFASWSWLAAMQQESHQNASVRST